MENRLRKLFDLQYFEKNEELDKIIADTEGRYQDKKLLSEEELDFVSAAGEAEAPRSIFCRAEIGNSSDHRHY